MRMSAEVKVCDLCGGGDFLPLYTVPDRVSPVRSGSLSPTVDPFSADRASNGVSRGGDFAIVRCKDCGLVLVNPRPSEEEILRYYPETYGSYHPLRGFHRWIKRCMLAYEVWRLKRLLPRDARILDVGTGSGEEAAYIAARGGWSVETTDISPFAVAQAKRHFCLEVRHGRLEDLYLPGARYDLVRMNYVLSHVHAPKAVLTEAKRILKPGGRILLRVPNRDSWCWRIFKRYWEGQEPPRHLFSFSPRTMRRYLHDAGFVRVSIRFSIVPNTSIHSARNFLVAYGAPRWIMKIFTLNPVMLALFFPAALAAAAAGRSDRIKIIAQKQ